MVDELIFIYPVSFVIFSSRTVSIGTPLTNAVHKNIISESCTSRKFFIHKVLKL